MQPIGQQKRGPRSDAEANSKHDVLAATRRSRWRCSVFRKRHCSHVLRLGLSERSQRCTLCPLYLSVYAYFLTSSKYGVNLGLFLKEDLSLVLHGKRLCQKFNSMLAHYVKTTVPMHRSTQYYPRRSSLLQDEHRPVLSDRVSQKQCDRVSCSHCFTLFLCERSQSLVIQVNDKTFLSCVFPKGKGKDPP